MTNLIRQSTFAAFTMVSALYAIDEYMPVPSRVMQINMGVERTSIPGTYQDSWETDDKANENNPTVIPMQGKFGLLDGLEGSMAIRYLIEDERGHTGLDRPVLGLKYGDPVSGAGGFLAVGLPVGFDDIMNAGNFATMTFGGMFDKDFPQIRLFSNASYSFNTEDDNKYKIDNLHLFAKPEYPLHAPWLTLNKQYVGLNLGLSYDFYFNNTSNGQSVGMNKQLIQIIPGTSYTFNKILSLEINVPISVAGQNIEDTQTFRMQLYFTLDEGLYNSL